MSRHHPDESLLTEFAGGQLSPAVALCVRVHLNHCALCQQNVERLMMVGGALLDSLPGEAVADSLFDQIMARIEQEPEVLPLASKAHASTLTLLQPWLPSGNWKDLAWKTQWFNVFEYVLQLGAFGRDRLSLVRINAGGRAPGHGHHGREVTVVLQGGFSDARGHYEVGDFVVMDGRHQHSPRAFEDGDCICLSLLEGPVRLTGALGQGIDLMRRFFNPALYRS